MQSHKVINIPTIQVDANTSQADAKLDALKQRVNQINTQTENARSVVSKTFSDGTRLLNLMLVNIQQNQAVQAIQAAQQVIQTAISINTIRIQATASFAAGNIFSGSVLTAAGIALGFNLIAARMAEAQAKRNLAVTMRVNRMRNAFR